jgi:hypothetical protein
MTNFPKNVENSWSIHEFDGKTEKMGKVGDGLGIDSACEDKGKDSFGSPTKPNRLPFFRLEPFRLSDNLYGFARLDNDIQSLSVCKFGNIVRNDRTGNCYNDAPLVFTVESIFLQAFDMLTDIVICEPRFHFNKNNKVAVLQKHVDLTALVSTPFPEGLVSAVGMYLNVECLKLFDDVTATDHVLNNFPDTRSESTNPSIGFPPHLSHLFAQLSHLMVKPLVGSLEQFKDSLVGQWHLLGHCAVPYVKSAFRIT